MLPHSNLRMVVGLAVLVGSLIGCRSIKRGTEANPVAPGSPSFEEDTTAENPRAPSGPTFSDDENQEQASLTSPSVLSSIQSAWVKACKAELADPKKGAAARQDLLKLTNTDDCEKAYPSIKAIIEQIDSKR